MVIDHGNFEVGNIRYQLVVLVVMVMVVVMVVVMVMMMVMVMVTTKADCKTKANTFVQVNLKSCCVVPEELSTFAKENRVRRFLKLICDWFCKTVTLKNEKSGDPAHPL